MIMQTGLQIKRADALDASFFGARLVFSRNIPRSYMAVTLPAGYALAWPAYFKLPHMPAGIETIDQLFRTLTGLTYSSDQNDPNAVFVSGGNCQSLSICFVTGARKLGYVCGFIPLSDHVCCWIVIEKTLYRVDVSAKEFSKITRRDLGYLIGVSEYFMQFST
jgi:hypothetical protein